MFVKRLELIGFKSFAERSELEIAPGVTAVVGPNGSGKSNIADAIRWVLGEQSIRTLRGNKLEDIIFAGSDSRKPVNYAEVRLLLDNSDHALPVDFTEVAVSRRVYRSGDSEFYINQTACRLKDISELFMDTGMGHEAYSIIGQGRIEEILSNKPEERRGIFEEAAGIVKFKVRRKEAEKKLYDADQSLVRVRDLIAELSLQLEPLEARSKVALEYRELLSQVDLWSATVLTAEFDEFFDKHEQLNVRIASLEQELAEIAGSESEADSELIRRRANLEESEQLVSRVQADRLDATASVEKNEGDLRVHAERKANLEHQHHENLQMIERIHNEMANIQIELEQLDARQMELDQTATGLRAELKRYQEERLSKNHLQQLRKELSETRSQLIERMRQQATDRNEWHNAEQQLEHLTRRWEKAKTELVAAEAELAALALLQEQRNTESLGMKAQLTRIEAEKQQWFQSWQEAKNEKLVLQQKVERLEKTRGDLQSRWRALQGMHENRQGFANGPKSVMHAVQNGRLDGVIGAVSDLFKVKKDWETAIETALGGSVQNIVTTNEDSARKAIAYLKKNNMGRATFLPLSVLAGRKIPEKDRQLAGQSTGFVGVASDLVEVESRLLAVAEFLLGQVLVVENLEMANAIASKLHYRYRIVTLDGDVVHPGGSMTGGSQSGRGSGLLAINRGIEEVQKELKDVEFQLKSVRCEMDLAVQKEQEMQKGWNLSEERHRQWEQSIREKENEWRLQAITYQRQAESEKTLRLETAQLQQEYEEQESRRQQFEGAVVAIEAKVASTEQAITILEQHITEEEAKQEEHQDEWTEWRVKLAECEEALRSVESSRQRFHQELTQHSEQEKESKAALMSLQSRLDLHAEEEKRLLLERDKWREQLANVEEALKMALALRQEHANAFASVESEVQKVRNIRRQKESQLHEWQVQLGKLSVELTTKENELREKHGLGIELARTRYPLNQPLSDAKKRLGALREDLKQYEGVNLGDIEEYERLRERHHFLVEEEADLEQAQTQLRELIAEMDAEMGKRFMETFTQVKTHFQEVFQALFGGGRADLQLTGSGDPLTDGVDILAEPPGKKLQILSLLSGGERALTALALLFSILKVRPVPFCVLDEVEAALDEVNVTRFAEYLKQFSKETQFIMITHRRGTMESADVLYGVTMQDTGVSKLVSVRVMEETA